MKIMNNIFNILAKASALMAGAFLMHILGTWVKYTAIREDGRGGSCGGVNKEGG